MEILAKDTVSVKTTLPGPMSLTLLKEQERDESTAVTYPKNIPLAIKRASGPYIEDMDGNTFLDFLTGAGVLCMGHNHPDIVDAATKQLSTLTHSLDFPTPVKEDFRKKLIGLMPSYMQNEMRVHFSGPTGADAVETAIKIARSHTGRTNIISFQGSYHGSTGVTMGLTGYTGAKSKQPEVPQGVSFFPFSYCYRCPVGLNKDSCETNCLQYLEKSITDSHSGMALPAAVIIEPVQGEGGSIPATQKFMKGLEKILKKHGILLIVDEVQTGIGRTGTWFAFEQFEIEPDLVVSSKALSGIGQPISAVLYKNGLKWEKGAHIGTFRGNQVAIASAVANLDIMKEENILSNVRNLSKFCYPYLNSQLELNNHVGDVRGLGLMIGVEIVDPMTGKPSESVARQIQKNALNKGLIVELGGRDDAVIRLLPPLNIDESIMKEALDILISSVNEATNLSTQNGGCEIEKLVSV